MSDRNGNGNRNSDRRGGKSYGGDNRRGGGRRFDRRDDSRGDNRGGRREDNRGYRDRDGGCDERRGYGERDNYRGGRNSDRRDDRRNDRRDDRRDNRSGGNRDDKRGYGRREDDRRNNRRNDFRDDRRGGRRDDRRNDRGGRGDQRRNDDRGFRKDDREKDKKFSPQRSGFREERLNRRMTDPDIPSDINVEDLDPLVLQDLRVLSKENADAVAKHMIMAATWMDDDPQLALRHARAAKDRAGRVSVARELNGIAAYRAGEWKEALAELRAARRMSGGPGMIAVMADCERGLGRPEKAIELSRSDEAQNLDRETGIELAIVVAGARIDMDQAESAVVTIQRAHPDKAERGLSACRLAYAYGNALAAAGRREEAVDWFQHAVSIDEEDWTDAQDRLAELNA